MTYWVGLRKFYAFRPVEQITSTTGDHKIKTFHRHPYVVIEQSQFFVEISIFFGVSALESVFGQNLHIVCFCFYHVFVARRQHEYMTD